MDPALPDAVVSAYVHGPAPVTVTLGHHLTVAATSEVMAAWLVRPEHAWLAAAAVRYRFTPIWYICSSSSSMLVTTTGVVSGMVTTLVYT